jgi:hypothetical protein
MRSRYDPFYTCTPPGYNSSLLDEIEEHIDTPIITNVGLAPMDHNGSAGSVLATLRGFNLCHRSGASSASPPSQPVPSP